MKTDKISYKKRQYEGWKFRLKDENHNSMQSHFVTINYDSEKCPKTITGKETISKRDIQLYLKRIRKTIPLNSKSKFYCSGNYDQKTGRPKYYIIFFNVSKNDIERNWKLGQIKFDQVNEKTIKKVLDRKGKNGIKNERIRPFILSSKGLGSNYLNKIPVQIKKSGVGILKLYHRYYTKKTGYTKNRLEDENLKQKISLLRKRMIANKQIISRKKNQNNVLEKNINNLILNAKK